MLRRLSLLLLLCLSPFVAHAQREKLPEKDLEWVEKNYPEAKKSNTGIRYVVEKSGAGEMAKAGDVVSVLYTGRLITGETFDETTDPKKPFTFRLGRNQVIQGWDQVLKLMRPGDKWTVIIPPELAYGSRGTAHIPRNATLIFVMELLAVKAD